MKTLYSHRINTLSKLRALPPRSGAECDVMLTADEELVVAHSKDLDVHEAEIESMTLEGVRKRFPQVPTLEEYLEVAGNRELLIEIKASSVDASVRCAEMLLQLPVQYYVIESFSLPAVERVRQLQPQAKTLLGWPSSLKHVDTLSEPGVALIAERVGVPADQLTEEEWGRCGIAIAQEYGFHAVSIFQNLVTQYPVLVQNAHAAGLELCSSIATTAEEERALYATGVDMIVSETTAPSPELPT